MQYWLKLKLGNKRILSFSIKLIRLHELVQARSVLFLFQTNFVWQCKAFAQFYNVSELEKNLFYTKLSFFNLLVKKILVAQLPISCVFFMERKAFFSFFNMKKSIWQNYELLILISLWKQSLGVALQKKVYYKKLF